MYNISTSENDGIIEIVITGEIAKAISEVFRHQHLLLMNYINL